MVLSFGAKYFWYFLTKTHHKQNMDDKVLRIIRFNQDEEMDTNCNDLDGNSSYPPSFGLNTELNEDALFISKPCTNKTGEETRYNDMYRTFLEWEKMQKLGPINEFVLLKYFTELSADIKPIILWKHYYSIKNGLCHQRNHRIDNYSKLQAFVGPHPRKLWSAFIFSEEEVNQFLKHAPDEKYLHIKVALIFGLKGSLKSKQMHALKICNIKLGTSYVVSIPQTPMTPSKIFSITSDLYKRILQKYLASRQEESNVYVFYKYQSNEVTHRLSLRSFCGIAESIASYFNIDIQDESIWCDFLQSSAAIAIDSSGNCMALKSYPQSVCNVNEAMVNKKSSNKSQTRIVVEEEKCKTSIPVIKKVEVIAGKTINIDLTRKTSREEALKAVPIKLINCKNCKFNITVNNYLKSVP